MQDDEVRNRMEAGGGQDVAVPIATYEEIVAVEAAGDLINRKWKLAILYLLARAPHRYNAMLRTMQGITPKMLTQQLRALQDAGVIEHVQEPGRTKHAEYRLTGIGDRLRPTLATLAEFARQRVHAPQRPDGPATERGRLG